jgi:hypothetical protein
MEPRTTEDHSGGKAAHPDAIDMPELRDFIPVVMEGRGDRKKERRFRDV